MALQKLGTTDNAAQAPVQEAAQEPITNLMAALIQETLGRKIPTHSSAIVIARTMREINETYQHCMVIHLMSTLFYKRYPELKQCGERDLYDVKDICQVARFKEGTEIDFENAQQRQLAYSAGQRLIIQETAERPITAEEVESLMVEAASWCINYLPPELCVLKDVPAIVAAMNNVRAGASNPEYLASLPTMAVGLMGTVVDEFELYGLTSELLRQISAAGVRKEEIATEVAIAVSANEKYISLVAEMIAKYK